MVKKGKAYWTGWVLSILPALLLLFSGVMKLRGGPELEEAFEHLGLPLSLRVPIGILELACLAVYLVPRTTVLGAVLLAGYLGGAVLTHLRVGDPFVAPALVGVALWLGLWLRDDRLKALLPLRTPPEA